MSRRYEDDTTRLQFAFRFVNKKTVVSHGLFGPTDCKQRNSDASAAAGSSGGPQHSFVPMCWHAQTQLPADSAALQPAVCTLKTTCNAGASLYGYLLLTAWRCALAAYAHGAKHVPGDERVHPIVEAAKAWLTADLGISAGGASSGAGSALNPPEIYLVVLSDSPADGDHKRKLLWDNLLPSMLARVPNQWERACNVAWLCHMRQSYVLEHCLEFCPETNSLWETQIRRRGYTMEHGCLTPFAGVELQIDPELKRVRDAGVFPAAKIGRLLILWRQGEPSADGSGTEAAHNSCGAEWLSAVRIPAPVAGASGTLRLPTWGELNNAGQKLLPWVCNLVMRAFSSFCESSEEGLRATCRAARDEGMELGALNPDSATLDELVTWSLTADIKLRLA